MEYRLTTALRLVAYLHLVVGTMMLIAPWLAFGAAVPFRVGGWLLGNAWLLLLGAMVMAAGVGLLRRVGWAWLLALLIAASGAVVVSARLYLGGPPAELWPPLLTNVLVLAVLLLARRALGRPGPSD